MGVIAAYVWIFLMVHRGLVNLKYYTMTNINVFQFMSAKHKVTRILRKTKQNKPNNNKKWGCYYISSLRVFHMQAIFYFCLFSIYAKFCGCLGEKSVVFVTVSICTLLIHLWLQKAEIPCNTALFSLSPWDKWVN